MILASKKATDYSIVRALDAGVTEIHAAEELSRFLNQITGASFPIYQEDETILYSTGDPARRHLNALLEDTDQTRIYVGGAAFGARMGYTCEKDLGKEGFSIHTQGDALFLIGGLPRGVLYAVYSFLETYCGCRWFTDTVSRIPTRATLEIAEIDDTQIPVLEYREPYYSAYPQADWHVRNKMNGNDTLLSRVHGGRIRYKPFVHTFNDILDPAEHFAKHPEYFSEVDGKREWKPGDTTQLCLTNPEVLALAKAKVRQWIKENPDAAIISVSQNDWYHYCTCEKCRALDEREGSHMGTLLAFVNSIAEDIEKDYPDVAIDTLAYQYTRKPPKTLRPRPNVIIRLCSIECCFAHPFTECTMTYGADEVRGGNFVNDVREWGKICQRLYVWDYVVNFHHNIMPHPNFAVLQKNIQFLVENHVVGIFEQGNSFVGKYGEFDLLKRYVLSKLLWNPDCDMNTVVNEYLVGVYGNAAAEVRKYYDLLQQLITPEIHMGIYENPDAKYMTDEFLQQADECLLRAERTAENDDVLERVQTLRLSVRYTKLSRMPVSAPERPALLDAFERDINRAGITTFYFRQTPEEAMKYMRKGDIYFYHK